MAEYETIIVEIPVEKVGLIRLNRPKALNALNNQLMSELHDALSNFDNDPDISCIVITGNERAFAAGADIKEMAGLTYVDQLKSSAVSDNFNFSRYKKPIIAAVSGYALGGGCEMSMACDMIVASETAVFGQPEINLGILPGGGGTQRMTRALGKALAMEVMLTDRKLSAEEALNYGLVNRVVAPEVYLDEALKLASKVASMSQIAIQLTKDAINQAYEGTLTEGLVMEKKNFLLAFGTEDKQEGMEAFVEKRKPQWKNK
ncbi:MAG: enoyl-CoA hydratase-related protein [Chloroflexota bacterium]